MLQGYLRLELALTDTMRMELIGSLMVKVSKTEKLVQITRPPLLHDGNNSRKEKESIMGVHHLHFGLIIRYCHC